MFPVFIFLSIPSSSVYYLSFYSHSYQLCILFYICTNYLLLSYRQSVCPLFSIFLSIPSSSLSSLLINDVSSFTYIQTIFFSLTVGHYVPPFFHLPIYPLIIAALSIIFLPFFSIHHRPRPADGPTHSLGGRLTHDLSSFSAFIPYSTFEVYIKCIIHPPLEMYIGVLYPVGARQSGGLRSYIHRVCLLLLLCVFWLNMRAR